MPHGKMKMKMMMCFEAAEKDCLGPLAYETALSSSAYCSSFLLLSSIEWLSGITAENGGLPNDGVTG